MPRRHRIQKGHAQKTLNLAATLHRSRRQCQLLFAMTGLSAPPPCHGRYIRWHGHVWAKNPVWRCYDAPDWHRLSNQIKSNHRFKSDNKQEQKEEEEQKERAKNTNCVRCGGAKGKTACMQLQYTCSNTCSNTCLLLHCGALLIAVVGPRTVHRSIYATAAPLLTHRATFPKHLHMHVSVHRCIDMSR